jgi:hypothetical protein
MIRRRKFILMVLVVFATGMSYAQTEAEESSLKAAFIYNFTHFIEWDDDVFTDNFIIGVVGNSLIDEPLEEIARTRKVGNKNITIRYYKSPEDIEKCNILFISKNNKAPLSEFLTKPELKKTLIIGEKEDYALKGAGINFVILDKKLKFEVNKRSLDDAGLKVSAQLLKLAIIIN